MRAAILGSVNLPCSHGDCKNTNVRQFVISEQNFNSPLCMDHIAEKTKSPYVKPKAKAKKKDNGKPENIPANRIQPTN